MPPRQTYASSNNKYYDLHKKIGAGEGNRTLVIGLEGRRSTIELHPPDFVKGNNYYNRKSAPSQKVSGAKDLVIQKRHGM